MSLLYIIGTHTRLWQWVIHSLTISDRNSEWSTHRSPFTLHPLTTHHSPSGEDWPSVGRLPGIDVSMLHVYERHMERLPVPPVRTTDPEYIRI